MKSLYIQKLTAEEREAIEFMKSETGCKQAATAVRRFLVSYQRMMQQQKETIQENLQLHRDINRLIEYNELSSDILMKYKPNRKKK